MPAPPDGVGCMMPQALEAPRRADSYATGHMDAKQACTGADRARPQLVPRRSCHALRPCLQDGECEHVQVHQRRRTSASCASNVTLHTD
jgi:hypothetical protein